jgi:ATP-dependent exoDNAse (exonuclease V) beta subunit
LLGLRPWELLDPVNLAEEQRMNREEGERIAYVAATRARDLLVVSALGERDRKLLDETWLSPLHEALYPPADMFRTPAPPPGCDFDGHTTVLKRPDDFDGDDNSVKPGLHYPKRGDHTVVWIDPAALDLTEKRSLGLQYEDVLTGSGESGLELYRAWQAKQAEIIDRASRPLFVIERATEAALADSKSVELVRIERQGTRPSGRAFGKLVHALLQQAELPVRLDDLRTIAQVEARILASSESNLEPAIETARIALQHPLLAGIATATRCHREFPVLLRENGKLIEGVIDLAFLNDTSWTIVDFKTGPADKKRNRGQLELYRKALKLSTGKPVRAVLFEI